MKLRGQKLTMAILEVAQDAGTDEEIAAKLKVTLPALRQAMESSYFAQRVQEERKALKLRVAGCANNLVE